MQTCLYLCRCHCTYALIKARINEPVVFIKRSAAEPYYGRGATVFINVVPVTAASLRMVLVGLNVMPKYNKKNIHKGLRPNTTVKGPRSKTVLCIEFVLRVMGGIPSALLTKFYSYILLLS